MGTGTANALFLLGRGGHRWVLRRPPAVRNDPSAADTKREWRILRALDGTDVPHPAARLLCEDPAVIGCTFMIMDVVDGFTPGHELPPRLVPEYGASGHGLRRDLAMAYVDGCAALSQVDWADRGLEGLGKPEGFLERQVGRWTAQLDRYRTRPLPELGFVAKWLEANRPAMSPAGILHGDYSPFNVMVAPDPPARLAAIVDWDTGTIGDPLLDIGHLLGRWTEPGEEPVIGVQAGGVTGYPTRAEMAARYAERTGRDLSALAYYEALALFKLAVILEGSYARQAAAGVPDSGNTMTALVPRLLRGAAEFARGERA
jgi:aminoglycoside phosphotransferase (APT) family kinase protein